MSKFKVGDSVKVVGNLAGHNKNIGDTVYVTKTDERNRFYYAPGWYMEDSDVVLISNNINNMNIIEKIKLARMGEPEKTLTKAGLMEMSGDLTSEGKEALNDLLVQKYKEELKTTYALPIIEEQQSSK